MYLSSLFTNDGKYDRDIERRVNTENKVNGALLAIMNSKSISRQARLAIHTGVLIPMLMYGSESWVWQKKNESRINAVELRSLHTIYGVSRKDRCRNNDVKERCGLKKYVVNRVERGWRGKVILLTVIVSWLLLLAHCAWHATLAAFDPYGSLLNNGTLLEHIMQNLGLVSYSNIDPLMAIHYLAPELVMASTSLVVYLALKKLLAPTATDEGTNKRPNHREHPFLTNAGKYVSLFLIMFSGIMRPSITSGVYFLVFMGVATAWSLGRPLERGYAVVGRCLMAIMSVHVLILIVYQCTWITDLLPPDNQFARYFGLTTLVEINSTYSEFTYVVVKDGMWATLASPLIILFTYFVLALETRQLFKPKPKKKSALTGVESGKLNGSLLRAVSLKQGRRSLTRDRWMNATKKVKLIRAVSPSKFSSIRSRSRLHQDSTGSVIVPDDDSLTDQTKPTMLDEIITAIIDFFQVLVRSSYIATSITMMAWSIMFHSWITFVFLVWANIVWLCPNQRSCMLKSSPVLVCYAMLLLIAQYIYGMNLTEAELPSNITEVNLYQIGFGRSVGEPCVPLLIKSLFTCMFWITLRQRVQEMRQRRQSAVVADMAAPLQLTVSTAASAIEADREREGQSRLLNAAGKWLREMCAHYWIYVVVIMLFVIGITGDRMTIFRIIYMFLFLSFILVFQIPALPLEEDDASKSPRPGSSDSTAAEHSMAVSSALEKSRSFHSKHNIFNINHFANIVNIGKVTPKIEV
ncbi:Piezo-type mechanosensitive ion channel component [Eumeta japonica]|uniref:Piezo-type mechanosensitive ion channel component n=1 Tax=Eumeta variegata TaxID=151549 RepID=A0A4C1UY82_EUMVA|nr:Piezo-type mechanosensitive ion channel component [Eumeta japonica]